MAVLVTDPFVEEHLLEERRRTGADRYDEVWEGTYMMTPLPDDEHQQIVMAMGAILQDTIGWLGLGHVRPGVNLTDREKDWALDYRAPDLVVFLAEGGAENRGTHWRGPADFVVEITSPGDRTREKLPFYSRLGVRELLVVDRSTWTLELYRWQEGELRLAGRSTAEARQVLLSQVVPLQFDLLAASPRPRIEVRHVESGRKWLI